MTTNGATGTSLSSFPDLAFMLPLQLSPPKGLKDLQQLIHDFHSRSSRVIDLIAHMAKTQA